MTVPVSPRSSGPVSGSASGALSGLPQGPSRESAQGPLQGLQNLALPNLALPELGRLMPLHLLLDPAGRICGTGPTLHKVALAAAGGRLAGRPLEAVFEILRPERMHGLEDLLRSPRLRLRLRSECGTWFKGTAVALSEGGVLLNLSFGFGLHEAVRVHELSDTDFAATDLAVEFLYLVEAKEAVFAEARTFSRRLHGARDDARQQAITDPLTGLHNRRGLENCLTRLAGSGEDFGMIHIDLDHFKAINDTLGHAVGDLVLVEVARRLLLAVRERDRVARIGGDEFVVILPGLGDAARLSAIAGRIAADLKCPVGVEVEIEVGAGGRAVPLSASLGAVLSAGGAGLDLEALLLAADRALYRSKDEGRGRVTIAEGPGGQIFPESLPGEHGAGRLPSGDGR